MSEAIHFFNFSTILLGLIFVFLIFGLAEMVKIGRTVKNIKNSLKMIAVSSITTVTLVAIGLTLSEPVVYIAYLTSLGTIFLLYLKIRCISRTSKS